MKNLLKLSFVVLLGFAQNINAQEVIPHLIPCIDITPANIVTLGSGIQANDCIESEGVTVTFNSGQNYSIKAGEYIAFENNTVIEPDASHLFHAYIQSEDMDLAWYYPNSTPGTVGQYEKLELGVKFNSTINAGVQNYVDGLDVAGIINPFDPDQIDLYAEFWYLLGGTWYGPVKANGFYYEDYVREGVTWEEVDGEYKFRIRYAPEFTGTWRCKVSANCPIYGGLLTTHEFTFEVAPSSNKGFVSVGDNKRYLKVGNEPYFPVGQNLTGPNREIPTVEWDTEPANAELYLDFHDLMTELADNGANYFRYIVSPWQSEIEYEHLGNYANRMSNAWEFDQILNHAKDLDLKLHYNMAMHYTFESPTGYAMTNWDWSAKGDSLNPATGPNSPCWHDSDVGYCYRNELDMPDPLQFLTDSTAMSYYKKRIRYMVARWSYSTEIGIMELMSEANNFGNTFIIERILTAEATETEPAHYGCKGGRPDPEGKTRNVYEDTPEDIITDLRNWQVEMCRYIKEDLGCYQHPLAVDFTGLPNKTLDNTYYNLNVDIANTNHYALGVNKAEVNFNIVEGGFHDIDYEFGYLNKPMMNPEYGTNSGTNSNDHNTGYIKRTCLTPFTGTCGSALSWGGHKNKRGQWVALGPVQEFFADVPLNDGDWHAQPPIVQDDLSVELLYLRQDEWGENTRIMGAISNRTFNYFTQGDTVYNGVGDVVGSRSEDNKPDVGIYQTAQDYINSDMDDNFKFTNMGVFKGYDIQWTNALTGEVLGMTDQTSNLFGNLKLDFPVTLTGDSICPILYFKLYRSDATFLTPINSNEFETSLPDKFKKDEEISSLELTKWESIPDPLNSSPVLIIVSPNPTTGQVKVTVSGTNIEGLNWLLTDSNGKVLKQNKVTSPNFSIDLSVYSNGIHYFSVRDEHGNIKQTVKILKQ